MNTEVAQRAPRHPLVAEKPRKREWLVPIGLAVWSFVPIVAGAFRRRRPVRRSASRS